MGVVQHTVKWVSVCLVPATTVLLPRVCSCDLHERDCFLLGRLLLSDECRIMLAPHLPLYPVRRGAAHVVSRGIYFAPSVRRTTPVRCKKMLVSGPGLPKAFIQNVLSHVEQISGATLLDVGETVDVSSAAAYANHRCVSRYLEKDRFLKRWKKCSLLSRL